MPIRPRLRSPAAFSLRAGLAARLAGGGRGKRRGRPPATGRAAARVALLLAWSEAALAEDRAVVVGIDDYSALAPGARLQGAVADARRVADFLTGEAGFAPSQVALLLDAEAESPAISSAIIDLIRPTRPGDRVVVYFAGLGTLAHGPEGIEPALIGHDGRPLGLLLSGHVTYMLDLIADRDVTVIVDAGFGGPPTDGGGAGLRSWPSEAGDATGVLFGQSDAPRTVWAAAAPGGQVWEDAEGGAFTGRLLDALSAGAATNGEALAALQAGMADWCTARAPCAGSGGAAPAFAGAENGRPLGAPAPAPSALAEARAFAEGRLAAVNPAGLGLELSPPVARIGDPVTFRVKARREGALLLLDVGEQGLARPLAPPFDLRPPEGLALSFTAAEPVGSGFLLGILLEGPGPAPGALLAPDGGADAATYLPGLLAGLDGGGRGWSAALVPYETRAAP